MTDEPFNQEKPVYIPLAFLERSGDNTWALVHHMVASLVNEPGVLCAVATALPGDGEGGKESQSCNAPGYTAAQENQKLQSARSNTVYDIVRKHTHTSRRT